MTDIDLNNFTGPQVHEVRQWMLKPWRFDGRLIATNGHVLIAIPDDGREGVAEYEPGRHPNVAKMLAHGFPDSAFVPLPELELPRSVCPRCDGAGKHFLAKCDECESGSFSHGLHEYTCIECDGNGWFGNPDEETRCAMCEGWGESGSARECSNTVIGKARFQTRYLRPFAKLPNARIAIAGHDDRAVILFDGGIGIVMPMRQ